MMSPDSTASSPLPAKKPAAVFWSLLLPGLGHYYAGVPFPRAFLINAVLAPMKMIILAVLARFIPSVALLILTLIAVFLLVAWLWRSALRAAEASKAGRPARRAKDYIGFVAAALAVHMACDVLLDVQGVRAVKNYMIPTVAMEPTLVVGDRVMAKLRAYASTADLRRGDILVFKYPPEPKILYVQRLIGLPGDKVRMDDGVMVINGVRQPHVAVEKTPAIVGSMADDTEIKSLFEETLDGRSFYVLQNIPSARRFTRSTWPLEGEYEVAADSVFVMGDNRDNATDSRVWGDVPLANIVGRADTVIFSIGDGSIRSDRIFRNIYTP